MWKLQKPELFNVTKYQSNLKQSLSSCCWPWVTKERRKALKEGLDKEKTGQQQSERVKERGATFPCTYSWDPSGAFRASKCLWRASAVPHPAVEQLYVQQHKREERERGKGGKEGGKEGEMGVGGTNHVTSLLLTSPRAATKRGMLSYLLYSVGRRFLSRTEKTERSTSASTHTHTEERKKVQNVPRHQQNQALFTKKPRGKIAEKEKKPRSAVCCWCVCGGSSIECALLLSLSLPYTHALPHSLSLTHAHRWTRSTPLQCLLCRCSEEKWMTSQNSHIYHRRFL